MLRNATLPRPENQENRRRRRATPPSPTTYQERTSCKRHCECPASLGLRHEKTQQCEGCHRNGCHSNTTRQCCGAPKVRSRQGQSPTTAPPLHGKTKTRLVPVPGHFSGKQVACLSTRSEVRECGNSLFPLFWMSSDSTHLSRHSSAQKLCGVTVAAASNNGQRLRLNNNDNQSRLEPVACSLSTTLLMSFIKI